MNESPLTVPARMAWVSCAACWGQRRIAHQHDGCLTWTTCSWCLGIGETLVAL
ncbi:MAG: hypothetical protein U0Y82_06200 [Thermoleophilia bacterium]